MARCAMTVVAVAPCLTSNHYKRAEASGDTIITENDCRILQSCQMDDGATREEVAMDVIDQRRSEREAVLLQANREELVERIGRTMRQDGSAQPLPGLHLYRHSIPLEQVYSLVEPSVCVVAQGSKEFLLGESRYRYDPFHYLLVTVDLPYVGQVLEASKERPFLSLRLDLAPTLLDAPDEARVLLPLVTPEIIYRLPRGGQGARPRHLAVRGG